MNSRTRKNSGNSTTFPELTKQSGGLMIDLRQILITTPIMRAVKTISGKSDFNFDKFKRQTGEQGFTLKRLTNLELRVDPISVKPVAKRGVKINGSMKQVYEIIDGRHRFAYAIANDKDHISANIISSKMRNSSRRNSSRRNSSRRN